VTRVGDALQAMNNRLPVIPSALSGWSVNERCSPEATGFLIRPAKGTAPAQPRLKRRQKGKSKMDTNDTIAEQIEDQLRQNFQDSLQEKIDTYIEQTREEREELLAEQIEDQLRQNFQDSLQEKIDAEVKRLAEAA
jgi:polyribonucleotide nucleotidyltransferase